MKNLVKSILIIGLGSAFLSSCILRTPAKDQAPVRSITVSGTGSVSVKPDMVSVKFIVKSTSWNCPQAAEKNAINTSNAIAAIREAGIPDSDISTCDYSIIQDNTHAYAGEYTVRNTISVLIRNVSLTEKVIDAAVKNNTGANGVTSFEYFVSDKTTALREARTLAIKNAQDAASLLAGASGCKVNGVIEIRENFSNTNNPFGPFRSKDKAPQNSIEEENITVTSNVTVKYELSN